MATIRYFAAAAAAAQTASENRDAATLGDLLAALTAAHGPEFERVLGRCTMLVDGVRSDDPATRLDAAAGVDVLPPFAGG
jgi:sulfur-carrier protein